MSGVIQGFLLSARSIFLHPFHWAWRIVAYGLLVFVLVVVGSAAIQWHSRNLGAISAVGGVLGKIPRPRPSAVSEVPMAKVVTGGNRKKGVAGLLGRREAPVKIASEKISRPINFLLPTAAEVKVFEQLGFKPLDPGEKYLGLWHVPCEKQTQKQQEDAAAAGLPVCAETTDHRKVRGMVQVTLAIGKDGTFSPRYVFSEEQPDFFEWSGPLSGWQIGAGPTYGIATGGAGAGLGATLQVDKRLVRTGRLWWKARGTVDVTTGQTGNGISGRVGLVPTWESLQ